MAAKRFFFAAISSISVAIIGPACGINMASLMHEESVEILRGLDSAGATIEIKKEGPNFVQARIADVVLGTGEAEISSAKTNRIVFSIEFPVGVTITYFGNMIAEDSDGVVIEGTWQQHATGIFGPDAGAWQVTSNP